MRGVLTVVLASGLAAGACGGGQVSASKPDTSSESASKLASVPAKANDTRTAEAAPKEPAETTRESWREITIPAGTTLRIVLDTAVGSDISQVEEPVRAHLSRAITVDSVTALPEGSHLTGVVTDATRSGKVKGRAHVAVRFDSVAPRGGDERYNIHAAPVGRTAESTKKKDALEIGAPAAGGAVIGGLLGGKKGALIGTAAGAGAGTAVVLSTRGEEVRLAKGSSMTLRLKEPVNIRVRG